MIDVVSALCVAPRKWPKAWASIADRTPAGICSASAKRAASHSRRFGGLIQTALPIASPSDIASNRQAPPKEWLIAAANGP